MHVLTEKGPHGLLNLVLLEDLAHFVILPEFFEGGNIGKMKDDEEYGDLTEDWGSLEADGNLISRAEYSGLAVDYDGIAISENLVPSEIELAIRRGHLPEQIRVKGHRLDVLQAHRLEEPREPLVDRFAHEATERGAGASDFISMTWATPVDQLMPSMRRE